MRILTLLLVLGVALAGCATNPDDPGTGGNVTTTTPPTGAEEGRTCTGKGGETAANPTVVLTTTQGVIRLTLLCDKAPLTGQHIVKLIEAGCYDGTLFHRVVAGFMNQGGDPTSKDASRSAEWGTGGPSDCGVSPDTIAEEFYCADGTIDYHTPAQSASGHGLKHDAAGVWSMARTSAPHTSGSQFFLTAAPASFLDGSYTVFGRTADDASKAVVLKINNRPCGGKACADPPRGSSRTDTPVHIETATVEWG